jgi:hypothetical protein
VTRRAYESGNELLLIEHSATLDTVMLPEDAPGVAEDYDANGVDLTLIRACQRESPLECLQALEEMQQLAESVMPVGKPVPPSD